MQTIKKNNNLIKNFIPDWTKWVDANSVSSLKNLASKKILVDKYWDVKQLLTME